MVRKILWNSPLDNTVTNVEISYSSMKHGAYIVASTIDATNDGNPKTSSNRWVGSYTHADGSDTDWYKLRFFDGTYYSEYSEPTTTDELVYLCSIDDVKKVVNTVGRWGDSEISQIIKEVTEDIYDEMGTPIKGIWSMTGQIGEEIQSDYYVGEMPIYKVDRVFYGTTTKHELFQADGFDVNKEYGMIRIATTGTSGVTLDTNADVEVHYVPRMYSKLATFKVVQRLLEKVDTVSGGDSSKELDVINARVNMIYDKIQNVNAPVLSSDFEYYQSNYGVNLTKVVQDHSRNKYYASYGW